MTEILLKCPKCGTEYHLPAAAIPPEGRDVECTECNNSWLALAGGQSSDTPDDPIVVDQDAAEETSSDVVRHASSHSRASQESESVALPGDMPPTRRPIPDNVLKILREEVEYERRARMKEKAGYAEPDVTVDEGDDIWPATTITEPVAAMNGKPARKEPVPKPEALSPATMPAQVPVVEEPPIQKPAVAAGTALTEVTEPARKSRSGYFAGFGTALIAAALALVVYLMPVIEPFADELSQYQKHVDAGRIWLQERVGVLGISE